MRDWRNKHQGCHTESHAKVCISELILVSLMYVLLDVVLFKLYHLILYSCSNFMVILLIVTLREQCWCQT